MELYPELKNRIVDFLISLPQMTDGHARQAFIGRASIDTKCEGFINYEMPTTQFFRLLVPELVKYGTLEDGREALERLLETAKRYVGRDRRKEYDILITMLLKKKGGENDA